MTCSARQGRQPVTPAGEGWTGILPVPYPLPHKPHPVQLRATMQQPQHPSSSPQVPAEARLLFMFLRWEVSHTWYLLFSGMSLGLELSSGIGSLCSPIQGKVCSKPK